MSVKKERGFIMKTAGKSVLKVLLSFTVAISCLIGIGMTSVAIEATPEFEQNVVYRVDDKILIKSDELGIRTAPTTVVYVHSGEELKVSAEVDEKGLITYGFSRGDEFIQLSTPQLAFQTDGLVLKSGDGKSLETAFVFEVHSTLDDEQKAVQDMIDALPGVDEVTEEDRADIEAAREAYEALTDEQKEDMYINKLNAVENQIDKNKAAEVIDLIDAIGEVDDSDECRDRIQAARDAYDELTDNQRTFVTNYNDMFAAEEEYTSLKREKTIKDVTDKINALPAANELTITDYYEVYEAGYLFYEELTEEEQAAFDPALKKKLDEAVTTMFSLAYEAGQQMLDDYGDILKTIIDEDSSEYDWIKERLEEYEPLVASGKTPDIHDFNVLLWSVICVHFELYDYYVFTEGADAAWTVGSTDSLVFRIRQAGIDNKAFDNTFDNFKYAGSKIYIDGELTDSKFITAEEGSVIITIMPEFLKTLSTGEHTISVLFENDVTVTSKFTIKPAASVPASGESVSHYVILGISAVLLAGAVLTLRKHMVDSVK